jgi:hypothetical protein
VLGGSEGLVRAESERDGDGRGADQAESGASVDAALFSQ